MGKWFHLGFGATMEEPQEQPPDVLATHTVGSEGAHVTSPQVLHPEDREVQKDIIVILILILLIINSFALSVLLHR